MAAFDCPPIKWLALILALVAPTGALAAPYPTYEVVDKQNIPGATRWDVLTFDGQNHHLFITRGESVDVLDVTTKQVVGSIPDTHGAHAVALASEFGKGFVTDGAANTVTVFDTTTLKTTATVATGTKPDVILYDPTSHYVFVANGASDDITVLNAEDNTTVGTIKLDGQPEFAAIDGKGKLYVNLEDKSQIAVIGIKDLKVVARYNLTPNCDGPTGLAIDVVQNRLFASCGNKVMVVVQAGTGKIVDTLPIGAHSDGTVFDSVAKLAFSSNGDGTLTVIGARDASHYQIVQNLRTVPTARTMALDPATHKIYLAAAETEGFDPPTAQHPQPRPHIKPDTFMIVTVDQKLPYGR